MITLWTRAISDPAAMAPEMGGLDWHDIGGCSIWGSTMTYTKSLSGSLKKLEWTICPLLGDLCWLLTHFNEVNCREQETYCLKILKLL